jgi:serine/threonine-protein phosphatase 2A activator
MDILEEVLEIAKATPPVDNKLSRFGNPAFKTFYDRVAAASQKMHESIPGLPKEAIPEVETYFQHSWGNRERVDYGSGHELNFLCWLWVLCSCREPADTSLSLTKLGVFHEDDYTYLVLGIFWR